MFPKGNVNGYGHHELLKAAHRDDSRFRMARDYESFHSIPTLTAVDFDFQSAAVS
jgi:hypothetical protein